MTYRLAPSDTDTPPATHDLLGMNTPQHPAGQSSSNNGATNSAMGEVSLFGDETETQKPDGSKKNKDSIMALYGSSSQKQTVYGVPGNSVHFYFWHQYAKYYFAEKDML